MPKIANRPLKERERFFVNLYVKGGADKAKIPACEKRAHLSPGSGKNILRRPAVQKDILARMEPQKSEQVRQRTLGDAVELATKVYQEQLAKQLELIRCHKIEMPVLLGRLMQGVIGIDMNTWPQQVLEYIKTAMVVEGAIQAGNTKRLIPAENPQENPAAGVYTSLFNRLGSQPTLPETPSTIEANAQDGASDLFPDLPKPVVAVKGGIPLPGESIDETPARKPANPNVIVVEVG